MSITTKVRKLVGPGSHGYGRGMKWLYVGTEHTTNEQKMETINQLMSKYGGIKIINGSSVTYVFKIDNNGSCKTSIVNNEPGTTGMTVIDYTDIDWESTGESINSHVEKYGSTLETFEPTN